MYPVTDMAFLIAYGTYNFRASLTLLHLLSYEPSVSFFIIFMIRDNHILPLPDLHGQRLHITD